MAFALRRFLRRTSPALVESYLATAGAMLQPEAEVTTGRRRSQPERLLAAIQALDAPTRDRVYADFERVAQISDEAGQRLLHILLSDGGPGEPVHSGGTEDRALALLIEDPDRFSRIEEMRYADVHVSGRDWSGFRGPLGAPVHTEQDREAAFREVLSSIFLSFDGSGRNVSVELFERPPLAKDGTSQTQVTIYLEGLPQSFSEFDGETLSQRIARPAVEAALLYTSATGELDVISKGGKQQRSALAAAFCEHMLAADPSVEPVRPRQYDLHSLARRRSFPTKPSDAIREVEVTRLRLVLDQKEGAVLSLEKARGEGRSIWDLARDEFGAADPLRNGHAVRQARLAVTFEPRDGRKRPSVINVDISVPNRCNLKEHKERERLIAERYLGEWGLLKEA